MARDSAVRAVVLVEGASDQVALETLARRRGRDLPGEGVAVIAMSGITNLFRYLNEFDQAGVTAISGLYDVAEERYVRQALLRSDRPSVPEDGDLETLGFFGCDADLEDELIRALGIAGVEEVIEAAGELRSLRLLQGMPAQRDWTYHAVLRRFIGVRSGRKARYAALLVDALDLDRMPRPLTRLLARV